MTLYFAMIVTLIFYRVIAHAVRSQNMKPKILHGGNKMKKSIITIIYLMFIVVAFAQDTTVTIELKSGDKVTGEILEEDDIRVIITTQFGELEIPKNEILSIIRPGEEFEKIEQIRVKVVPELNQEARWRTIWSSMIIGNSLYGIGVPHVLGINDFKIANGMRLLMFGGGFYASLRYTKGMDLPMGRWRFQMAGAQLGGMSIFPIMAIVGFENWFDFDEEGKVAFTYVMAAVPFGVWKADQLYKDWNLTNGQAYLISQSTYLGALNSIGIINLIHSDDWEWSENLVRLYTCLTYSGSIAGSYIAKKYVTDKSYTEDDAIFINISASVGFFNSIILLNLFDIDRRKPVTLFLMAGVNGFTFLADKLNQSTDLTRGQGSIIGLGTYACYLTWLGIASIIDIDYGTKFARVMDLASITSGWYLTYRWVTGSSRLGYDRGKTNLNGLTITPAVFANGDSFYPGLRLQVFF